MASALSMKQLSGPVWRYTLPCPKCGHSTCGSDRSTRTVQWFASEDMLAVACPSCGYEWKELPLDRREPERPLVDMTVLTSPEPEYRPWWMFWRRA
jgi:C4-type Zn-finger protein